MTNGWKVDFFTLIMKFVIVKYILKVLIYLPSISIYKFILIKVGRNRKLQKKSYFTRH